MPRPNLFIVGAPKCGTTAWVEYLRTHPDVFFPGIKEPHYFAADLPGVRQIATPSDYAKLFAPGGKAKIIGDASVLYLYSNAAAQAIYAYDPSAKIIIFLRAQEDFLPSVHHQYLYDFRDTLDFEPAWRLSGCRPPDSIPETCSDAKLLDYEAVGDFRPQLERYLALFPTEQIRIIQFRDWTSDPRATYLEMMDFLRLEDDGRRDFPRVNVAKAHRFKGLGRFIYHPPKAARMAVNLLKKLTGKSTLGLAKSAAKVIEVPGYTTKIDPQLREEIRAHYAEENRLLDKRILATGCYRPRPSVSQRRATLQPRSTP